MDYLSLIGRHEALFENVLLICEDKLVSVVSKSRFLVIGGGITLPAGTFLRKTKINELPQLFVICNEKTH